MLLKYGYSGWIRVETDDLPGWLYVRLEKDDTGRWRTHELYVDGHSTLTPGMLRRIPLGRIEALAVQGDGAGILERSLSKPGPQLRTLAATYASYYTGERHHCESCGGFVDPRRGKSLSWPEGSWWSELKGVNVPAPKDKSESQSEPAPVTLTRPDDGRLTDEFLDRVVAAYAAVVRAGSTSPAKTLHHESGIPERTIHKWVYLARKRGRMPAGKQGTVG
jgi:hypothetical protein